MTTSKYKSGSTSQLTFKNFGSGKFLLYPFVSDSGFTTKLFKLLFYSFEVRIKTTATNELHEIFARSSLLISSSGGFPLQPSEAPSELDGLYSAARTGDLASSFIDSIIRQFLLGFLFSFFVRMAVAILFVTVCVHSYGHAVSLGLTSFIILYPRFA